MVGKNINSRGASAVFETVPVQVQFLILKNVKKVLQGKWAENAMLLPIAAGKCS
jgi:hypothetical protein